MTGCDDPRRARLAQALRTNLKRRKAAGRDGEAKRAPMRPPEGGEDAPSDPSRRD